MKKLLLAAGIILLVGAGFVTQRHSAERDAVREAVLDYVEGIYEVQPDRIKRSVHPSLAKLGYWRPQDATDYQEGRMSFEELIGVAERWNASGRVDPKTAPKEIEIYDMLDQTATVKLSAQWGVDYMHLAKVEGKWMIMNVLWQSYPPNER